MPVPNHDIGNSRCEDEREPGDVLLPLHAELVPPRELRAGEEPALRVGSQFHPGWRDGPIPRVDNPGAGERAGHRREGQEGCSQGRLKVAAALMRKSYKACTES